MSLKKIRENVVENQIKQLSKAGANKALEDAARTHYKMGNDYFKEKNYSLSYYAYFLSFQEYASVIVSRKAKELVESGEAIDYLIKKKELKKEVVKNLRDAALSVVNRKHLERKDCVTIREIITSLRKQVA